MWMMIEKQSESIANPLDQALTKNSTENKRGPILQISLQIVVGRSSGLQVVVNLSRLLETEQEKRLLVREVATINLSQVCWHVFSPGAEINQNSVMAAGRKFVHRASDERKSLQREVMGSPVSAQVYERYPEGLGQLFTGSTLTSTLSHLGILADSGTGPSPDLSILLHTGRTPLAQS
ncbi:hypothetical protein INR49_031818 [Caranx melampygus]|nr:hypothetical protein INR49_031818 [Caranx melampygus]